MRAGAPWAEEASAGHYYCTTFPPPGGILSETFSAELRQTRSAARGAGYLSLSSTTPPAISRVGLAFPLGLTAPACPAATAQRQRHSQCADPGLVGGVERSTDFKCFIIKCFMPPCKRSLATIILDDVLLINSLQVSFHRKQRASTSMIAAILDRYNLRIRYHIMDKFL
eukprot:2855772-Pleurochrysis_carterae.AAC.5